MAASKEDERIELFFPYYINQGRLLDLYSILNGGYSEYSEIKTAINEENKRSGKAEASVSGGFKLFNFGGNISGNLESSDNQTKENTEKKVQTVTSVLSIVKNTLSKKGYLHDIQGATAGQFVLLPVNLSINSVKSMMEEISELLKLSINMQKIGVTVKGVGNNNKQIDEILKTIHVLFSGEEVLSLANEYAVIGNIVDDNLYQATRSDLIQTELYCLAQVKRVYYSGTELMKNTIFSKIKDASAKQALIDAMRKIANGDIFDFEAGAVFSISDKPVYQLEIIALYQKEM